MIHQYLIRKSDERSFVAKIHEGKILELHGPVSLSRVEGRISYQDGPGYAELRSFPFEFDTMVPGSHKASEFRAHPNIDCVVLR